MGGSKTVVQAPAPAPAPDYSKISRDTLQAQIDLAPQLFAAEASPVYGQAAYANLQNQVNNILLSGQMAQFAKYYPELANIETDYQTQLRQGELEQITSPELGLGAYQQAFNQLTPGYQEAVAGMGELAKSATEQSVQRPTYAAYEEQIEGPSYGQYIGQIQGPSADLTLGGMQAYNFGGVQETPYEVGQSFLQAQPYQVGQRLLQNQPYQVGQEFLNQPAYQAGLYTSQVTGPQTQSKLGQIDTGIVNAYMNQLPGVAEGAQRLAQQINLDLSAGRSLSPEEERLATQSAREAYAARGMALGPQAIGAEILAREELANQRYRERQAAAQQAMGAISSLYTPALQQSYQRQAGAEEYNLGAQGQAFGQAISQEDMSRAAQAQEFSQLGAREQALAQAQGQQYSQLLGTEQALAQAQAQQFGQLGTKEQALAGAQAQRFGQAITEEEAARQAQAQEFAQRTGLQELGLNLQGQQYQQAMGQEALAQQTQNQALQQALQRTQQGIAGQQAMLGLQGQQAQIGAAAMGALQGAQAPILQAFYRQPILSGSMGQAQQFALGGQQMAGPGLYNPESQMAFQSAFLPYQANIAERTAAMQANATASAGRSGMMGGIIGGIAGGLGAAF